MRFPIPKRYREILLHPLRARQVCTALAGASLEVRAGDRIAVMGPNGAGKTTLLRLMGGLFLPTQGDVIVNGFSTLDRNLDARKSVGFVFNEETKLLLAVRCDPDPRILRSPRQPLGR